MSIPLVQNNDKDAINTSIIAIKRQIERINMLLGLSNSEEIDTSVFATKDELQQAVTDLQPVDEVAVDNMQSVTSNAVAKAMSYSTEEQLTGGFFNGKPVYCKYIDLGAVPNSTTKNVRHNINNLDVKNILKLNGFFTNTSSTFQFPYRDTGSATAYLIVNSTYIIVTDNTNLSSFNGYAYIEYTKTTY